MKKRPLYLGLTMCLSAFGMLLIATPHFFGRQRRLDGSDVSSRSSSDGDEDDDLCDPARPSRCSELAGGSPSSSRDVGSLVVIFSGIFLVGVGVSFYYSFGIPYVDDNSGKTQSPFLLSVVTSARTLGPSLGYLLGGFCLKIYVEPTRTPEDIDEDDHRCALL